MDDPKRQLDHVSRALSEQYVSLRNDEPRQRKEQRMETIKLVDEDGREMTLEPRLVPCLFGQAQIDKDSARLIYLLEQSPNATPEQAAEMVSKVYREKWRVAQTEHAEER